MSDGAPRQQIDACIAALARAMGHEHRLALLEQLAQGECTVEGLSQRAGLSLANVSQHLQKMRASGLVVARRAGKHVLYRLADGPVVEALTALRRLAEHNLAEVRQVAEGYYGRLDGMAPVSREALRAMLEDGTVTLLDVRPEDEYRAGHVPGALNITLDALEQRLAELPRDREIVAYCRGPYCILAYEAARSLRRHGFRVRRLEDGLPEWRAAGLPVARCEPRP